MNRHPLVAPAVLVAAALALTGCSTSTSAGATAGSTGSGTIAVVASTNVWGDIAASVGGDHITVTSIIDDPDKDPHEYEADAQNQLALSKAAVVIQNGGGYDDFVTKMLSSSGNKKAVTLDAVDISGKKAPAGGDLNEHVWYDFPTVDAVIDKLEATLARVDAAHESDFQKNADALKAKVATLGKKEADLKASSAGEGVAITEPVPLYMLDSIGLVNKTPAEFSKSIEEGTDAAPDVLQKTLALLSDGSVKLLAYNEQTTGAQTEAVLKAAKDGGIAVVPVTETLPRGKDYISWMTSNLNAIASALGR